MAVPVLVPSETVWLCNITVSPGRSLGSPEGSQLHDHIENTISCLRHARLVRSPPETRISPPPSEAICISSRTLGLFVTALEEEVQSLHLLGIIKEYGSKVSTSNISLFKGKDLFPVQTSKR